MGLLYPKVPSRSDDKGRVKRISPGYEKRTASAPAAAHVGSKIGSRE